jgi:transcriptional regulator with XRE-family HTH domain
MAKTKDALKIIDHMVGDDAGLRQMIADESVNAAVAQMIYDARTNAGLTQEELAELLGTKQPVIARLEDAEYEGHSLSMLNRIAKALNQRLVVDMKTAQPELDTVRYVFHKVVQDLRRDRRMTVDELAGKTSIPREEIIAMERNPFYRPPALTLHRLATFYGIPQRRLAELAGASRKVPKSLQKEASRFAAKSESFAGLSREQKKLLDAFVKFLKTEDRSSP